MHRLEFLIELVKEIRPSRPGRIVEAEEKFRNLLQQLRQDPEKLAGLRTSLWEVFQNSDLLPALLESGLISSRSFVQELGSKLKHKIVPEIKEEGDFLFVISRVFFLSTDHLWVAGISRSLWQRFFRLLRVNINVNDRQILAQLNQALRILSYRLTTLGLEKEISRRLGKNQDALSPFLEQNQLVSRFLATGEENYQQQVLLLNNIQEQLHNCRQTVIWLRDQKLYHGTSLAQTFLTTRIFEMVERMLIISDVLDRDNHLDEERFISYFITVVTNENRRNSVREFLSENLGLLAYQIAEHKGKKGEKYITTNREEYRQMFNSAVGGGVIVSFVAVIKIILGKLYWAPFWTGFIYSVNYSAGFVLMDKTGTTLATKQPAYTASAVAVALDSRKQQGKPDLQHFAINIANIMRSQTASFAGNLLVVFPLSYVIAWLLDRLAGYRIIDDAGAFALLEAQHPWHSWALLYACFTGVFLFLSGVFSGYVENHIIYGRMADRIRNHPLLRQRMSPKRLNRLVDQVNSYAGAISGSIFLGFCLGMSASVGKIFGIPFDIRHITISASNVGIGYFGLERPVPWTYMLVVVLGVLGIGFLNFFVSFSLAFFVAVRSRGVRLKDYPEIIGHIWRYFKAYPADMFFPPGKSRRSRDLENIVKEPAEISE